MKPEDLFVKHVEFSERFDIRRDLELDTVDDTFLEQFNLDFIGLFVLFALFSIFLVYTFLSYLYSATVFALKLLDNSLLISKKID